MTPKQADKAIETGKEITVHNPHYNETFTKLFIRRDRWNIYSADGGTFDRGDLNIVTQQEEMETMRLEKKFMALTYR